MLSVLVVDDEKAIADTLVAILTLAGFHAVAAYSGSEGISCARSKQFDVILTDVIMPGINGIQTSEEIRKIYPLAKVILVSGSIETAQLLQDATDAGMDFEIFAKPVHPLQIIRRLRDIEADGD